MCSGFATAYTGSCDNVTLLPTAKQEGYVIATSTQTQVAPTAYNARAHELHAGALSRWLEL